MKRLMGVAAAAAGGFLVGAMRKRASARRSYRATGSGEPSIVADPNAVAPAPPPTEAPASDPQGAANPDASGRSRPRWVPDAADDAHPLAMLHRDHRSLLSAIGEVRKAKPRKPHDTEQLRAEVQRIVTEASKHEVAEQVHVWPLVRESIPDGEAIARTAEEHELELKRVLHALDSRHPGDVDFAELLESLEAELRSHVDFEESRVWPAFDFMLSREKADVLADELKLAGSSPLTRPHPSELADPAKHPVLAKAVGLVDRGVDAVTARGRGPYSSQ